MSDLLHWFGEQSDAIKLALIGMFTGIFGGVFAVMREWGKPVLKVPAPAQSVTTTTAPRSADDPVLLLLNEVAAINAGLAQLIAITKKDSADREAIADLITELKNEMYLLRSVISNKTIGM